ncbi:MAG: ATP-binding protein [Planctomycetota bacterium]|nr:ATP-binding protein [Planctomycetota bacterium]
MASTPPPAGSPRASFVAQPPFLGRERELAFLNELADSGRPELFVLYGRRRVGKTELLQQFCSGRKSVYFLAAQVRDRDNLRTFRQTIAGELGDTLAGDVDFPDWSSALGFLAERSAGERLVVVLDEFPYLCEAQKSVPSQLQRFWDTRGKHSSLMLVLCGSQVSFMENEVLAERSPLFGRRTAQRRLEPLRPLETLPFFPHWPLEERVLAYSVLGGMPAYLRRFDNTRPLRENLLRDVLRPEGFLFDEVQFLLRSELSNPATYNSLLAAIARGSSKLNDIATDVGVDSTTANKYLHTLRELRLVEREVPLTDPDPLRSRRGSYRIADRFLQFHYRHLQPHLSLIHAGRGQRVLEQFVEPDLPRLLDEAKVDFVLDHLRHEAAELVGDELPDVARHPGRYVRAVARSASGRPVAAIVLPDGKLSTATLESELATIAEALGAPPIKLTYGLTSRPDRPLEVERVPDDELV